MSTNQEQPSGVCAPHDFGNRLAWVWAKEMPRGLKGGFLTMLYTLRTMASASGELRFSRDGKPIRIQDIARAAGCREQDARRYLDAGELAGVVGIDGRKRGKAATYAVLLCPRPNWEAADAHLKATARKRKDDEADAGSSGHSGTNSDGEEFGPQRHELEPEGVEGVRATEARWGSGHSGTLSSGHGGTNNPGVSQGLPQEMADVVGQQPVRAGEGDGQTDLISRQRKTGPAAGGLGTGTAGAAPAEGGEGWRICPCGTGRIVRADRDRCGGCLKAERESAGKAEREQQLAAQLRRDNEIAGAVLNGRPVPLVEPVAPVEAPAPAPAPVQAPALVAPELIDPEAGQSMWGPAGELTAVEPEDYLGWEPEGAEEAPAAAEAPAPPTEPVVAVQGSLLLDFTGGGQGAPAGARPDLRVAPAGPAEETPVEPAPVPAPRPARHLQAVSG